jgi:regulatory protein
LTDPEALAGEEDALSPLVIEKLRPTADGAAVRIKVAGVFCAAVAPEDADRLRLAKDVVWTTDLAAAVLDAAQRRDARRYALFALSQRSMARGRIVQRLTRRGTPRAIADATCDDFERLGLLDDERFAAAIARSIVERKPAGARYVEQKLLSRGVSRAVASRAAAEATAGRDHADDARELARKRVRAIPPRLDDHAARRRIYAMLARRGFPPDACRLGADHALMLRRDGHPQTH